MGLAADTKYVTGTGAVDRVMGEDEVRTVLREAFAKEKLDGQRVLVIIPDGTRSGPVDLFFKLYHELLGARVEQLDYLIALGTHQPMTDEQIQKRLGVSAEELATTYAKIRVFNHEWRNPDTFKQVGAISADEIKQISGGLLDLEVKVSLNKMLFDYDRVVVCGPVFPHEVAGFSGGTKYFFPGVSGREVINTTHWLGALITCFDTIGIKDTPVRQVIDRAASMIPTPKLFCNYVVKEGEVAGVYVGGYPDAWQAAADLSEQIHIKFCEKPYKTILAVMPEMYDDIWVAGKGMYKLEPVCAVGGEVIIYAPHIDEISYTHGEIIDEIGYHVRDYFATRWEQFKHYPWGVVAHSTHVKGMGTFKDGVETPRATVTLATAIPRARVEKANLNYRDPASIRIADYENREAEGILVVPHAGEVLHRLKR